MFNKITTIGLVALNFLVLLGNALVLIELLRKKSMNFPSNWILISLTLSDLLLGFFILPFITLQEYLWTFGEMGCKMWMALDTFLINASIYNLLAISLDRYMAVREPIHYRIYSDTMTKLVITAAWFVSALLAFAPFIVYPFGASIIAIGRISAVTSNVDASESAKFIGRCNNVSNSNLYIVVSGFVTFVLPIILMTFLNASIFTTVSDSNTKMAKMSFRSRYGHTHFRRTPLNRDHSNSTQKSLIREQSDLESQVVKSNIWYAVIACSLLPSCQDMVKGARHEVVTHRNEWKVARTTGLVVGCFAFCWLPFTVVYFLQAFRICPVGECVSYWVFTTAFWLGYFNSALNPLLYAVFLKDYFVRASKKISRLSART